MINNIADWMSSKNESLNGGDKHSAYKNRGTDDFPPNRGFRTIQELRLVADMTDEFFQILEPQVTIYGMRGINPNTASKQVIMSIDAGITSEIADEVIKRRDDPQAGPFKDSNDFFGFLEQSGARLNINKEEFPIVTDSLSSFKIQSIGEYNGSKREINVVTLDLSKVAERVNTIQTEADKKTNPSQASPATSKSSGNNKSKTANAQNSSQQNETLPKGPPRIVYWNEK